MTNTKIADAFEQVADLLEFSGANPFRVRAYRNGTTSEYRHNIVRLLTDRATQQFARYAVRDYYRRHAAQRGGDR